MDLLPCTLYILTFIYRVIKPVKKPVSEEERMLKAGLMPEPPLFSSSHVIESDRYRREKELKREREKEQEREREKLEKERQERERELERERQREAERERELEREREREREERERERERERARLAALDQTTRTPAPAGKPPKQKSSKIPKHPFSDLSSFTSASSPFPTLSPSLNQLDTPKVKKSSSKKDKSLKKLERTVSPPPVITPVQSVAPTPVAVGGPTTSLTSDQITSGFFFVSTTQSYIKSWANNNKFTAFQFFHFTVSFLSICVDYLNGIV